MKTWDGQFIGANWSGDSPPEEVARARAILERIFRHAQAVMERREPLHEKSLTLTTDEFMVIQRRYNLPDHPKIVLGVSITVKPD